MRYRTHGGSLAPVRVPVILEEQCVDQKDRHGLTVTAD